MIHPTKDPKYGIKDNQLVNIETGKPIPNDEPIMIFRAQDVLSPNVINFYRQYAVTDEHKRAVIQRFDDFNKFQRDHPDRVKSPDTTFPFPQIK